MSSVKALDSKVDFGMFLGAMGDRLKGLLASTMTPEEKLKAITEQLEGQVQKKRVLAREIGAQMRALSDPDTEVLEPLEALKARRAKLVKLGGTLVNNSRKKGQLGQISTEIKSLDAAIASNQATYDTLKESYELAKTDYQQAMGALETVKSSGPAMLNAIAAHKQALAARDRTANSEEVDTSFLQELQSELSGVQAELRSDELIDRDIDGTSGYNIDAALEALDENDVDANLMAEFEAAAAQ